MTTKAYLELDRELEQYMRSLLEGLGRPERVEALGWYTAGLLLAGERKSIAPIAARLSPDPEAARPFASGCSKQWWWPSGTRRCCGS